MDNLSSHKGAGVREKIRTAGSESLFLSAYSLGLNPIEMALRQAQGTFANGRVKRTPVKLEPDGMAVLVHTGVSRYAEVPEHSCARVEDVVSRCSSAQTRLPWATSPQQVAS